MNASPTAIVGTNGAQSRARSVSVVIPTYNNLALLRECLRSMRALDYPAGRLEVTVVDNGSGDGTYRAVHAPELGVRCVRLEQNTGFAAACNRGAAESSGDYVAFLNDDALADPQWLNRMFEALDEAEPGTVCVASRIMSRDGKEIEFNGASSNLFGVGRPRSVWGWPDAPQPPGKGSPLLFASGGAMLVHRRTFLDVGGFDPNYFAYFEDVDLGWRLWVLGYRVVYAPDAVVRHIGGATGTRQPAHRRYTLWECNSLATVLKNYGSGHMERLLAGALLLLYKRALLAAGDAFDRNDYSLGGPNDNNTANVERLPRVSVAHLAAIDRFNSLLPRLMEERRRIQEARVRPDREILPLLGRLWEPQFAGSEYAEASRQMAAALDLYGLTAEALPNRVLVLASAPGSGAASVASSLATDFLVALATPEAGSEHTWRMAEGYTQHTLAPRAPELAALIRHADALIALPGSLSGVPMEGIDTPVGVIDAALGDSFQGVRHFQSSDFEALRSFCRRPGSHPALSA
ncbi:MAG: glycosyltransferase family 2 protein [Chloroflexota bacterium]|nr:glycosyltransferase family 2 protein [Chloroflexota bacterium]MDQ5865622.1 glycosyltransferase family 2 protein [Chloroflexota bacterium]